METFEIFIFTCTSIFHFSFFPSDDEEVKDGGDEETTEAAKEETDEGDGDDGGDGDKDGGDTDGDGGDKDGDGEPAGGDEEETESEGENGGDEADAGGDSELSFKIESEDEGKAQIETLIKKLKKMNEFLSGLVTFWDKEAAAAGEISNIQIMIGLMRSPLFTILL